MQKEEYELDIPAMEKQLDLWGIKNDFYRQAIIRLLKTVVLFACDAYDQGKKGEPFNIGVPIKKKRSETAPTVQSTQK